jgi:hypothetical protein
VKLRTVIVVAVLLGMPRVGTADFVFVGDLELSVTPALIYSLAPTSPFNFIVSANTGGEEIMAVGLPFEGPVYIQSMPVPSGIESRSYAAMAEPVMGGEPASARPLGVGPIAHGGTTVRLAVALPLFDGPVDVYVAIRAVDLFPNMYFMLRPDGTLQSISAGLVPWMSATRGPVDEVLFGDIAAQTLPAGAYELLLAVTPAGSVERLYLWQTGFFVPLVWAVNDLVAVNAWPWEFSTENISLSPGDLLVTNATPVQVVDTGHLVRGKGTAFRVFVKSTFSYDVDVSFRLSLPAAEWGFVTNTGNYFTGIPPGWSWPEIWGPVTIHPGDNEVMLPHIPSGQREAEVSLANPAGIIQGRCNQFRCGPDVRVLPKPIADSYSFWIEVDPDDHVLETDEDNNVNYWSATGMTYGVRGWSFLFIPTHFAGDCPPRVAAVDGIAKRSIEYILGNYPIPDGSIYYHVLEPTVVAPCPYDASQQCGSWARWPVDMDRGEKFTEIRALDIAQDYSFIVLLTCGGGGAASPAFDDVVSIGADNPDHMLAHEFMHAISGSIDIYTLDCLVGWEEAYCEHADGTREYCCMSTASVEANNCIFDGNGDVACTDWLSSKACSQACSDPTSCVSVCSGVCQGGSVFQGPDCRPRHPASKGFWANRWLQIDERMNYFMDCNDPAGAPDPGYWIIPENTVTQCCGAEKVEPGVYRCPSVAPTINRDGYFNLLFNNSHFVIP